MRVVASPFDSQHYDLRVGHLALEPTDGAAELEAALAAARRQGYDVVFLRMPETHPLRRAVGSDPLETLVTSTLGGEHSRGAPSLAIERLDVVRDPAMIEEIAEITTETIVGTHYHADPQLPSAATRALYAAWARNDVAGRAQRTLVARGPEHILGYLTVLETPTKAMIDLVAVARAAQGKGIGSALIASFIDGVGERVATVGTQAHNPALRLYARWGFVPTERRVTYHLWLA